MVKNNQKKPEYKSIKIRLVDFKRLKNLAHKRELKLLDLVARLLD